MSTGIYFDTSALAKWYINESRSDEVEKYIQERGPVDISDLTVVEFRCLLARRRREKNITATIEMEIFSTFQEDIRRRFLVCHAFADGLAAATVNLIPLLGDIPVRTLDAFHLAIARELSSGVLVTADKVMAVGGKALGLQVVQF